MAVQPDSTERPQDAPQSEGALGGRLVFWLGVPISCAHLYFNLWATLPELWTSAIHFAGFGFLCTLLFPLRPATGGRQRWLFAVDMALGALALLCAVYLIFAEDAFYQRGSSFVASDWIFSVLCVLLAMELARRAAGWLIPLLIALALSYVIFWGQWLGGMFHFPGLTAETVLFRQYFGTDGMFGPIARISSTYVFMFILFGAFLTRSGAGEFIINLALCAAGRLIGGPGLVAVMGSALMGSISGSAVANTVSTGVITIPLMQRAGFSPRFAAGVEAAASTGGQLMPPVMGAGAFVMANYTGVSYVDIIAVATLPALLYFLSVGMWVRIEALKRGVHDMAGETPRLRAVLRTGGHHLIPIAVLITLLIQGFTPTYAAGWSILAVVAASWLSPNKMGLRGILAALALGARNMASVAVLLVAVGIIVNVVATTGIGNTFSLMIADWAGGSLLLAVLLIALASLVLGMGLPVTAAYIVLATLSAPALYDLIAQLRLVEVVAAGALPEAAVAVLTLAAPQNTELINTPMSFEQAAALIAQIPPDLRRLLLEQALDPAALTAALLSAHMVIYWLSQDSNVTPPVCLAAFAAAALAGTKPMRTGLMAWKIAKGLYIVPLLIALMPLLGGAWGEVTMIFIAGTLGIYALTGALAGHLEAPLSWPWRVLLAAAAVTLLWPNPWFWQVAGAAVLILALVVNIRTRFRIRAAAGTVQ